MSELRFCCNYFRYPDPVNNRTERQVTVASNSGGAGPLPCLNTLFAEPIHVVSTTIDTAESRDVTNLLIFTSTISLPLGICATLNFQITRASEDGGTIKVGPTFTFSTFAVALESESFAFQYADRNLRPGNYTYSVEVTSNSIIEITPGLTVNNATLSVMSFSD